VLRNQLGFGWDPTSRRVTATESVWKDYLGVHELLLTLSSLLMCLQAHPKAKVYHTKTFAIYDVMNNLCGTITATGVNVVATSAAQVQHAQHAPVTAMPANDKDNNAALVPEITSLASICGSTPNNNKGAAPAAIVLGKVCCHVCCCDPSFISTVTVPILLQSQGANVCKQVHPVATICRQADQSLNSHRMLGEEA
jgi:hypothetical protein